MSQERERIDELEAQLQQTREQLFQMARLVEMGKLVAVVAHELSQPLLGIKAFAQILQRRCKDDPYLGPKVKLIIEQAKVMEGIIDGLREFTRPQAPDSKAADPAEVVTAAVELLSERARKAHVEISTDLDGGVPKVRGARGHLQQVVVNLVANAIDALDGCDPARIQIRLRAQSPGPVLLVADSGPGIPQEVQPKLFEPFFTTKGPDRGTGLGLSICQEILQSHGGRIRLLAPNEIDAAFGAGFQTAFEVVLAPVEGAASRA